MDYEVPRCTRRCHATDRELMPGEVFYSVLEMEEDALVRRDYSEAAWNGASETAIGYWKSTIPEPNETKMQWAPNDIMLQLFDRLEDDPQKQDMRYVLALLLVRRRVMRGEGEGQDALDRAVMYAYCPRRDTNHEVPVVMPRPERVQEIQEELAELLFSKSL